MGNGSVKAAGASTTTEVQPLHSEASTLAAKQAPSPSPAPALENASSHVVFPSGRKATMPYPIPLSAVAEDSEMKGTAERPCLAVLVEGLMLPINSTVAIHGARVAPVFADSADGLNVLKRSIVFLMMMAARREFGPSWFVTVEHSSCSKWQNGYTAIVARGERKVTPEEVDRLRTRMRELVAKDLKITERHMGYAEACEFFDKEKKEYSQALVSASSDFVFQLACCEEYAELYRRPLVPRTGLVKSWELEQFDAGFVISFPTTAGNTLVSPFEADPVITGVYKEWTQWNKALKAFCVGQVNEAVVGKKAKNFIALCEAVQAQRMVQTAVQIKKRVAEGVQIILIAGPSSSGKTTFAAKLGLQLSMLGIKPTVISVDNYYKPNADCPRDAKGNLDFECLEALRVDHLNDQLLELFEGKKVNTPVFNFHTGKPETDKFIPFQVAPGGVVVMEGIHCLNDQLTPRVPAGKKFKIFLGPFTHINLDESNFISNSATRLIRRIVRDYRSRGYSALETLGRWYSVRAGEDQNIFPFMKCADVVFNTALDYELNVLTTFAKPLLQSVKPGSTHYNLAQEMVSFLSYFTPVPHDDVPPESLLREFIGGSFFETSH
eukprot:m51a1_g9047 putative uridine kinase (608) ;mRNA; r:16813-19326